MRKLSLYISIICFLFNLSLTAQEKIPLDHSAYDNWKSLSNPKISNDGKWISYEIKPAKGDGWLHIINSETNFHDSIARGEKAIFSPNSNYLAFSIKPQKDTIRKIKLAKKKVEDYVTDSLGIYIFENDSLIKIAKIESFKLAKIESNWMVYKLEKSKEKEKTIRKKKKKLFGFLLKKKKEKPKKKEYKQDGTEVIVFNPLSNSSFNFKNIKEYQISKNGKLVSSISTKKDSIDTSFIINFNTLDSKSTTVFKKEGNAKNIAIDEMGDQIAFIFSPDTSKVKIFNLYYWSEESNKVSLMVDTLSDNMIKNWSVSVFGDLNFSKDGKKLFFGTSPNPVKEPKDSLLDEEIVKVDVWNWKDSKLQPQQLKQLSYEKKKSYRAVLLLDNKRFYQLSDTLIDRFRVNYNSNPEYGIGENYKPYEKLNGFTGSYHRDVYSISLRNGNRELIIKDASSSVNYSPDGEFIIWYKNQDSIWYAYNVETKITIPLTKDIEVNFYNELHDTPSLPNPYGVAGWTTKNEYVLIYDRYDIWKLDPYGFKKAVNLTKVGRENSIRFNVVYLDSEIDYIDLKTPILLLAKNKKNKQQGFYNLDLSKSDKPEKLTMGKVYHYYPIKAKNADKLIIQKGDFNNYYDLYSSDLSLSNETKHSNTNPQQSKYLWGSVELTNWESFDGLKYDGLLYKPENFDSLKKYPMIVYFYSRSSDGLYRHHSVKPSRSVINIPLHISNGYIVFVPDITYNAGYPGKSAYDAIVSGTDHIINLGFVDTSRMGIQGQSWGGYQVAYLVTQTNKYKCAMAGAPVSNMTSAYGGIRWGSGVNRAFQYEKGQSRIGATLWEKPNLYIENSPLFYLDKVETPLLIMHNDNDGAVPWYQGIELFCGLRRLDKPVWMLTYNKEAHNLRNWPNTVDLSIRMMQFFDYYLKDAAQPIWMKEGIPAIDKGKKTGYELSE